jgi:hypothetical protein
VHSGRGTNDFFLLAERRHRRVLIEHGNRSAIKEHLSDAKSAFPRKLVRNLRAAKRKGGFGSGGAGFGQGAIKPSVPTLMRQFSWS